MSAAFVAQRLESLGTALHVGISVQITPGSVGGIAQVVMGLVAALGKLDGPERYTLIVRTTDQHDWLKPHCSATQSIAVNPNFGRRSGLSEGSSGGMGLLKKVLAPAVPRLRRLQHMLAPARHWPEVPLSDGYVERLGCDVVHFPTQGFMVCNVPTVYNPHDLQHLVYPQYVTQSEFVSREVIYPAGCRFSHTTVVGTEWIKNDVVRQYGVHPDKIQVIPWASPTEFYREPDEKILAVVREKYGLDMGFALYPAVTWPHKNHLRLLEAIAYLRDQRGIVVPLVCTGSRLEPTWQQLQGVIRDRKLEAQVKFLGFVADEELRALYRLCRFLVMPTLYEADSNPIHEAWYEGAPVASSNVTALPDQVHDAGILFDPRDVRAIADAMARLATDDGLCAELRALGKRRTKDFSWERTAKAYRAVYRKAADRPLSAEDRWLLEWDWMREPTREAPDGIAQA